MHFGGRTSVGSLHVSGAMNCPKSDEQGLQIARQFERVAFLNCAGKSGLRQGRLSPRLWYRTTLVPLEDSRYSEEITETLEAST